MSTPSTDKAAIRQILAALTAAGYAPESVANGEEVIPVSNMDEALAEITAVDIASLSVTHPTEQDSFVLFVLGNDPEEVACDYGVSLSNVIEPLTDTWF